MVFCSDPLSYCPCYRTAWLRFGVGVGDTNPKTLQKLETWGRVGVMGAERRRMKEKENQDPKEELALSSRTEESQLHFRRTE